MSSYFNFTIERPNEKGEWVCVGKSFYDENLDIINPYILKGVFWDADFSADINSIDENKMTDDSFIEFSHKKNKRNQGKYEFIDMDDSFSICENLETWSKTRKKNNDVCLWFNLSSLFNENREFLKYALMLDTDDIKEILKFKDDLDKITSIEEFINWLEKCNNVILKTGYDSTGIIFNYSPYEVLQNIKYSPFFKNLNINSMSLVEYYDTDETFKKQYYLQGKISYEKDIVGMIHGIEKSIENMNTSKKAEEIAKSYISDIISEYEYDEGENHSKLFKRLNDYCKDSNEYDSEYEDELIAQKRELDLLLRFVGEKGRLIWNIS